MSTKLLKLSFTRVIDAKPAQVYKAWLGTQTPGSPWHKAKRAILDQKVDGLFYFVPAGKDTHIAHYGRFLKLQPGKLAQFTWLSPYTRGLESLVTFRLKAQGARTLLTLTHEGLPNDSYGRAHSAWDDILDGLVTHFGPNKGKKRA